MIQTSVRRQGDATVMTIPAAVLERMHVDEGTVLELEVVEGALVVRPVQVRRPQRYTLEELLQGVTPELMEELRDETQWFREGNAMGREAL